MDEVDHRGFYYQLTQEGQLRWLGPEKGVVGMAAESAARSCVRADAGVKFARRL